MSTPTFNAATGVYSNSIPSPPTGRVAVSIATPAVGYAAAGYAAYYGLNLVDYGVLPLTKSISGTVKIQSSPLPAAAVIYPGALLVLFARKSFLKIAGTYSDASGNFTFSNLPTMTEGYFIAAFDFNGSPAQNAIIFDRLSAI